MTTTTSLGDRSVGMRAEFATRPVVMGRSEVVTSGYYLATSARFQMEELCGTGFSAQVLSIDRCREHGIDLIPGDDYLTACRHAVGPWRRC